MHVVACPTPNVWEGGGGRGGGGNEGSEEDLGFDKGGSRCKTALCTACDLQLPKVIGSFVVAPNEQSENWSHLLSGVILVKCCHLSVLGRHGHATQVLIVTNCLQNKLSMSYRCNKDGASPPAHG